MVTTLNSARRPRHLSDAHVTSHAVAPSPHVPIAGAGVRLTEVNAKSQAQILFDITHDCDGADILWNYMSFGPFKDAIEMAAWMEGCATTANPLFYTLIDTATNQPFGMASYLNIHPNNASIEIGSIWFAPCAQRTTLTTEAIYLMMAHAFEGLKYRRLEWKCDALNAKSRSAARRFGFSFEGVFYNHMIIKGKNRDTAWFSITDDEWPRLRNNFEAWLAADNFDATGQQKTALSDLNWNE